MDSIQRSGALQSPGLCIYCGTTEALEDEHIVPFGLGGNWSLPNASCRACAVVTSRFERRVLRGPLRPVRVLRGILSRRGHRDAPTSLPLRVLRNGSWETVTLALEEYPLLVEFLVFSPPGYVDPAYEKGVRIRGHATFNFGPPPEVVMARLGATSISAPRTYDPGALARMTAKIAYGTAVAAGVIVPSRGRPEIVRSIMGEEDQIGRWVGNLAEPRKIATGILHQVSIHHDVKARLVIGRVQFLADSGVPAYGVILGATDAGYIDPTALSGGMCEERICSWASSVDEVINIGRATLRPALGEASADGDTVVLEFEMQHALGGAAAAPELDGHPLSNALRSLLGDGRPMKDFRNILFSRDTTWTRPVYWLGVLVHTAGQRVLFFPGFRAVGLHPVRAGEPQPYVPFPVEHITVERDRLTVHFTSAASDSHLGRERTVPVGEGVFAFAMHVRDPNVLHVLQRSTRFGFPVPASDVARRRELLGAIRKNAQDALLTLNPDAPVHGVATFLYVEVYVGPRNFTIPVAPARALPPLLACADVSPRPESPSHWYHCRVPLHGDVDVIFAAALVPGRLRAPLGIGGGQMKMPEQSE